MTQNSWTSVQSDEYADDGEHLDGAVALARIEDELDAADAIVIDLRSGEPIVEFHSFIPDSRGLLAAPGWAKALKRVVDVAGATVALLFLSPILLVTALAVAVTSSGPVLFAQERVGANGKNFKMLKFRSMYRDAEERREQLESLNAHKNGPVFKIHNDPRITPVGRIIRKLSIDELPQLLNVLGGTMSLVGPRPPLPREVSTYTAWHSQRLLVKPGITCIWQVSGRSGIDFDTWVEMDLDYIENWSLRLDLLLMARTIPAVLTMRGAY